MTLSFCGPLASLVCIVVVCVFFAACLAFVFVWMLPFSIFLCGFCVSIALFLLLFFYFGYVRSAGDEVACYVSMCFGCVGRLTFDNGKIPPHALETNNFASLSNKTFIMCSK